MANKRTGFIEYTLLAAVVAGVAVAVLFIGAQKSRSTQNKTSPPLESLTNGAGPDSESLLDGRNSHPKQAYFGLQPALIK